MKLPPSIRQLLLLAQEIVSIRRLLFNRFTLIVFIIIAFAVGGQAYINANDGNQITGKVVNDDGEAVANATVILRTTSLRGVPSETRTATNEQGAFSFPEYNERGQATLEFTIWATTPTGQSSEKQRVHVDFPKQNKHIVITVTEPAG